MNSVKFKNGFTLIELLIVIGIISIIISITIVSYGSIRKHIALDISANKIQSTIVEVREKTRSGFYEQNEDAKDAASLCFGFKVSKEDYVQKIQTTFDRLATKNQKCLKDNIKFLRVDEKNKQIIIKKIKLFGNEVEEFQIFFEPPNAYLELDQPIASSQNQNLIIIVGYDDSDDDNDNRVIVLNMITGNTFTDRINEEYK